MPLPTAEESKAGTPEENGPATLRFPKHYDPNSPEVKERRRKLFEDIARNRTPESDAAMEKVYQMFAEDDDIE